METRFTRKILKEFEKSPRIYIGVIDGFSISNRQLDIEVEYLMIEGIKIKQFLNIYILSTREISSELLETAISLFKMNKKVLVRIDSSSVIQSIEEYRGEE